MRQSVCVSPSDTKAMTKDVVILRHQVFTDRTQYLFDKDKAGAYQRHIAHAFPVAYVSTCSNTSVDLQIRRWR